MPGVVLYIAGDYGELKAFEKRVLTLDEGRLREEMP